MFGTLAFEMRKSGGMPVEYANLNERQATLLISFMRNTAIVKTMSSREIAELTGKEHTHVMRDIREMLEQLFENPNLVSQFEGTYQGIRRKEKCYNLPRRECEILITGYDV